MGTVSAKRQEAASDATPRQQVEGREFKRQGSSLFVWISDDRQECRCSFVLHQQATPLNRDELRGYLTQACVREGIIPQALEDLASRACSGQNVTMLPVARGTLPQPGVDGHVRYLAQASAVARSSVDDAARVDMHSVLTFINVLPGQEIGRIVSPTVGQPGRDVTGQTIPSPNGKPLKLKIGSNISLADDGALLISLAAGRVCQTGGEISVAEEFIVQGDVNLRIGSINFNGFVEVRGDVLDGFNITAAKGLHVHGTIGACAIRSDGDVLFCGMSGQKQGSIVCGGSITANYIHETAVECGGDLTVEMELYNSQVKALGRVIVNRGAICGGSCIALGGIEAKTAGSAASVPTELCAGIDYHDKEEYERLLAELEKNGLLMGRGRSEAETDELRKSRSALMARVVALRNRNDRRANPKINIKGLLNDNTTLCTRMLVREKTAERRGPFSVIENSIDGGLRFVEMTSLDVPAASIEEAYVREHLKQRQAA